MADGRSGGIGLGGVGAIVLIVIKAFGLGLFNWSWFAVISSLIWLPIGLAIVIFILVFLAVGIATLFTGETPTNRW